MGARVGGFVIGVSMGLAALVGPVPMVLAVVLVATARRVLGAEAVPPMLIGAGGIVALHVTATWLRNGGTTATYEPATPAVLAVALVLIAGGLLLAARGGNGRPGSAAR